MSPKKKFVFLMDKQLEISGVGLISMNMPEHMVLNITEMSYRETAKKNRNDRSKYKRNGRVEYHSNTWR